MYSRLTYPNVPERQRAIGPAPARRVYLTYMTALARSYVHAAVCDITRTPAGFLFHLRYPHYRANLVETRRSPYTPPLGFVSLNI